MIYAAQSHPTGDVVGSLFKFSKTNKENFVLMMMMRHDGKLYLNIKRDPIEADFLRY